MRRVFSYLLCFARDTTTSVRFYKLVDVLLAVVVRELVPCLDTLYRFYKNAATRDIRLTIWLARVVDIARGVRASTPIDHSRFACFKKIFIAFVCSDLFPTQNFSHIFNDPGAPLYRLHRKKAEARARTLYFI